MNLSNAFRALFGGPRPESSGFSAMTREEMAEHEFDKYLAGHYIAPDKQDEERDKFVEIMKHSSTYSQRTNRIC